MSEQQRAQAQHQVDHDAADRRSVLSVAMDSALKQQDSTADLVLMVDALGLDEELAELAGDMPERHRRLDQVRAELAELAVDGGLPSVENV